MRDGDLRRLFRVHLPLFDWQSIETGGVGLGVPDLNYCFAGQEGWLELKQTQAMAVSIDAVQVAWIERRLRAGGRVFVAVRRHCPSGPRREARDELWLLHGAQSRNLHDHGLGQSDALLHCVGGPAKWDWAAVGKILSTTQ